MPLMLDAAKRVKDEIGQMVPVSGTIVGPFTLASILGWFADFLMDLLTEPQKALKLIDICMKAGLEFAKAYINRGLGVAINESWIAPPLLSPDMYRTFAFESEKILIEKIKDYGQKNVALICGGNTTPIAKDMIKTGTSLIMADFGSDMEYYKNICKKNRVTVRASIQSKTLKEGITEKMITESKKVIDLFSDYEKFIFGCGIVSYDTDIKNVLELKKIISDLNTR